MSRFRHLLNRLSDSLVADEQEGGFAMRPTCYYCHASPVHYTLYGTPSGTMHFCHACLLKLAKPVQPDPELRWMEAQYIAPSAREDR